ncbi:hypothetical protein [Streptomyces anandii]|uniref:hypothetical protein n=1 Tax=Streptomyces anandii TaxID=285454 RepID=UPI00378A89B6
MPASKEWRRTSRNRSAVAELLAHAGLLRRKKVVVIDEAHAYDTHMSVYPDRVLS